ncbi:Integrase, catalytic core [Corchorus capsularis]|uniref:Integrase, catalytic core n=1 Tax=Corchorus capsularis TaxID=210143 RepID=A0A1R3G9E3_COCAP|nr:Integrase, catalytic core [Corchorus capsularis]
MNNPTFKRQNTCLVCGKPGHYAAQCRNRKMGNDRPARPRVNLVEADEPDDIIATVVSQANVVPNDVLHVPNIRANLISVSLLGKVGVKVSFESDKIVMTKNNVLVGKGYCNQGLFVLNIVNVIMNGNASSSAYMVDSMDLWHARLGHVSISYIKKMQSLGLISNLGKLFDKCLICAETKLTKKTCASVNRETELLGLIHTDLGDMKQCMFRGGKQYYVTFINDCSRFTKVYLLKHKDEAFDMFLKYKAEVENQLNKKIKRVRSDRGGEYVLLNDYCEKEDIIHEVTPPYSPESSGVAERKNRTLKEMMNAMLVSSNAHDNLWGEALLSACHVQNRIPYKKTGKTPYEIWKGCAPNLKYLKCGGCLAKVLLPDIKKRKVGSKTSDCLFIGYAEHSAAYRFLVLKSDAIECNTIVETKNAEFFEQIFPLRTDTISHAPFHRDDLTVVNDDLRRSKRQRKESSFVTRISSIRVLIALASIYKLVIHQMDVKTTFFNGDLEDCMMQPEGCIVPSQENNVCKLLKSLYGLKQAPKQWHEKFDKVLTCDGFTSVEVDRCVYIKSVGNDCVIISLYVDDMLIFGTCIDVVNETKRFLTSKFDMKDMGEANVILGVKIIRCDGGLMLTQEHYVERLLKRFGHFDVKPMSTPYDTTTHLKKN